MNTLTMDGTVYRTHAEVLNRFFGKHYNLHRRSTCDIGNDRMVWFVQVEPGKTINATSGYQNKMNAAGTHFTHIWPDASAYDGESKNSTIRIVFAKCRKGYGFMGVFERTKICSDHDEFERISDSFTCP